MSEAIDAMRAYFNQAPLPRSKFLLDTRNKINEMIDAVEAENDRLQEENEMLRNRVAGKYRAMLGSPNPVLRLMAEDELRELGVEVKE